MSDHSKALVPLESWCYHSPEMRHKGASIDIGLMAEALIYYDQVLINIPSQPQLAEFLCWFIEQGKYADLLALFNDQTLIIYHYAFVTSAIKTLDDSYILVNLQDSIQETNPNSFEQQFLYHPIINDCFKHARDRSKLYKALRDKVIEVKASSFDQAVENAKLDFQNPQRNSLLIQALLDEIYPMLGLGKPPDVNAKISQSTGKYQVTWNVNFIQISEALGKDLNFHLGTPLAGVGVCNRLLWSAANANCDLYLGKPMSGLVGDKLYETAYEVIKSKEIVEQLIDEVEFPDIRTLVNTGKITFDDILMIRKKASRFRKWLQEEGERDRNAIIAYHNEIAKETGLIKFGRKTLRLFGLLLGPGTGTFIGGKIGSIEGVVLGTTVGAGIKYLFDLGSKLGEDWKPVIFGNWLKERIEKILEEK